MYNKEKIMMERETGRPRGFGFITYSDRRGMEDAIREMDGREFGDRTITVNKAQPRMGGGEDAGDYGPRGGGYPSSGGKGGGSYGGGRDKPVAQDECFKCGRSGHWARDCPSAGGGGRPSGGGSFSSHSRFEGAGSRAGDRFADRDRFIDDRYDGGRFGDRDRFNGRGDRFGSRDRYATERYPPAGDRFADRMGSDRYGGGGDRYPLNGYGKERVYDRDGGGGGGPRGSSDRYGGGGPARNEGRSYRNPAPYDRPPIRAPRPSSFERY